MDPKLLQNAILIAIQKGYKNMNIHNTIRDLQNKTLEVEAMREESVNYLRAVGRQFALMYRHSKDKESVEAIHLLHTLIKIRKTVKEKLGLVDSNMLRFESKET